MTQSSLASTKRCSKAFSASIKALGCADMMLYLDLRSDMRRRDFLGGLSVAAWPLLARAQPAKILQVGFLYPGPLAGTAPRIAAVTSGLQAGGLRVPDQVVVISSVTDGNAALLAANGD